MDNLSVIILGAGQGTRMRSQLPKVLHELAGKPLVSHVIDTALALKAAKIVLVYGHGGELLKQRLNHYPVRWAHQDKQLGTGHAVDQAMDQLSDDETALILYGDVPLTSTETLKALVQAAGRDAVGLLTARFENPTGYGRIVRNASGMVQAIVEEKDANSEQKALTEINTGMLALPAKRLRAWLKALDNKNSQGEYYLTDVIAMAVKDGVPVNTVLCQDNDEIMGVNNKQHLAELERVFQRNQAQRLLEQAVTLRDPERFDLRGNLTVGRDVVIDVNVVFEGEVSLGDNVYVGPGCIIRDARIEAGAQIRPYCVIEEAVIGPGSLVGPFARIRPGSHLADDVHVGNFVEIKNTQIAAGSKVNHLSYVGDTTMGSGVNIGAGTITANYDGANKHRTVIGDKASVGSNCVLVAPVKVGEGATLGAGTVLRKDAPPGELTLSAVREKTISGWRRPQKKKSSE